MRIGVVTFPGTLDDRDALRAVRLAGADAVSLWHADDDLHHVDAVVLPGGFSYGDYLRAGALSSFAPIMSRIVRSAQGGMPVLGICNGFQILCEAHLLEGCMIKNDHRTFICRDQPLRIENSKTAWTTEFDEGEVIRVPLKNQDGQFQADAETVKRLEGEGRVVFRYVAGATTGPAGNEINPNGSVADIAGITNDYGNVVGLMPHPEHAIEPGFGPDMPGEGNRSGTDGLRLFTSALKVMTA